MRDEILVRLIETPAEMAAARELRVKVFVEEQGCPLDEEFDEFDDTGDHAVALIADVVIGTGRVYDTVSGETFIGRMAVDASYRKYGVGARILSFLEARAIAWGASLIELHAQTQAQGFYHRAGYVPRGEKFLEVDIEHILMVKSVDQ